MNIMKYNAVMDSINYQCVLPILPALVVVFVNSLHGFKLRLQVFQTILVINQIVTVLFPYKDHPKRSHTVDYPQQKS
jgi:hypothetical protein